MPTLEEMLDNIPTTSKVGMKCKTNTMLSKMEPARRSKVEAMIDDPETLLVALARILIAGGYSINSQNLSRHRRRGEANGCQCPR
ncbi:hypothetical protein UFOVP1608_34 [uncultured Caudovirales phage]|uniref:Uncharacterized protein n=1 Tax=uncultured Caudovirales phage TaxID=2100421 RepID=A0A6J5SSI8_9CAUD|nr:hypothetical protein UFOVP1608_34 [uncultured Caudovirales phage]